MKVVAPRPATSRPSLGVAPALLATLLVAGCVTLPADIPQSSLPEDALTDAWFGAPGESGTGHGGAASATAVPVTVDWWDLFDDELLSEFVRTGLESNQDVLAAAARVREAAAGIRAARSAGRPQAGAQFDYQRAEVSRQGAGAASGLANAGLINDVNEFYTLGTSVRWEADLSGRIRAEVSAARRDRDASIAARQGMALTVSAAIASTYLSLRSLQEQRAVAQDNVTISREQLEIAQGRYASGLAPELDVLRARGQLEQARASVPGVDARIAAATYGLATLLGMSPEALDARLAAPMPQPDPPQVLPTGIRSDVLLRRPDVIAARLRAEAAAARLRGARRVRFPQLVLTGLGGTDATTFVDMLEAASLNWLLASAARLPLYQGGALRAGVERSQAQLEIATLEWDRTALTALQEAETALAGLARARQERDRLLHAAEATASAADIAQRLYDTGLGDYLTALDARREDRRAREALAQARERVNLRAVDLYRALGGGWGSPPTLASAPTGKRE